MMEPQRRRHSVDETQDMEDMEIEMAELGLPSAANQHSTGIRVDMELRRRLERDLVLKNDSTSLKYKEAWFFIETSWMEEWMNFVLHDGPLPGPITNQSFYTPNHDFRKDLKVTKHYRCVNPRVYCIYAELYGTSGVLPIARYTLDIYATPILRDDVLEILKLPELSARVAVNEIRDKYEEWPEDEPETESWWYRCCCRCDRLPTVLGKIFGGPTYASVATDDQDKKKKKKRGKKKSKRSKDDETDSSDESDSDGEETGLLNARD
ncbi:hypothetical protein THRCLA_09386 [Thraustotheca clavata]|uniref:DUSP domain-containing protein n=1 Tax=Thraustotheca clavata TaxID=74557 RepID=A0A1V9YX23_9STRA|nr:hypothetical protein THRCLA_09386 [Thraustotheca clavata]